jgi:hypothetical protein
MQLAGHDIFSRLLNIVILNRGHFEGNLPACSCGLTSAVLTPEDGVSCMGVDVLLSCSTAKE